MKRSLAATGLVVCLSIQGAMPDQSGGVTARPVGFAEMVQESSLIVQGRVVKLEGVWGGGGAGAPGASDAAKSSTSPAVKPKPPSSEHLENAPAAQQPDPAPAPPVEVGTRGGRMLFTRVTMEADQPIQGGAGQTLEFYVAGGAADGRIAIVHGMPAFEVGKRYLLFLRNGYHAVGDPVVGVNQGFFEVVQDPQSGLDVLQTANADYVLGVENDRVVTRRNPQRGGGQPAGPPMPHGPGIQSQASPEVQRYWHSTEPFMTVGEFVGAIRARARR